ncbi:MAG: ABC transporter permease [Thermoanaerobaculia bacterium]
MVFVENFRIALTALRANKMRSILTTLGIIIGVAAVIAVVSIVQGLQFMLTKELQGVGATYVMVMPQQQQQGPGIVPRPLRLTWEDGQAIQQQVPGVDLMVPVLAGQQQVRAGERSHDTFVIGTNADWQEVNNHTVEFGRFFNELDLTRHRKVMVIGQKVAEELRLGEGARPVGQEIYVRNLPVTVIGVMEERGQALGQDSDDLAFLPFDTSLNLFGRRAGDQIQLRMQAQSADVVERVKEDITSLLRRRHEIPEGEEDDFQVIVQDEILETIGTILGWVTAVVGAVVSVALLVGGIGIMNIMLVSVTERTREIGVRKSVGARRKDILVQFLIEAITLSLVGGVIGLAIGYGLGAGVAAILPGDWPAAHVPLWAILLALGFSLLVGTFFGIYPAGKASRLDPIEALRYE